MKSWWLKYSSLPKDEKRLLWQALWFMGNFKLRLRFMKFNAFKLYYARNLKGKAMCHDEQKVKKSIQRAALTAPRAFNCLPQALAFKRMISNGSEYKLVIGIDPKNKEKLDAHAWVEKQDEILIGDVPSFNYLPLWEWK